MWGEKIRYFKSYVNSIFGSRKLAEELYIVNCLLSTLFHISKGVFFLNINPTDVFRCVSIELKPKVTRDATGYSGDSSFNVWATVLKANRGVAGGRKQPESIKLKKLKIKKSKRDRGYIIYIYMIIDICFIFEHFFLFFFEDSALSRCCPRTFASPRTVCPLG